MTFTEQRREPTRAPESEVDPQIAIRRRQTAWTWAARLGVTVMLLASWQLVGSHADPIAMSTPVAVARKLVEVTVSGTLPNDMLVTIEELVIGYVVGALVGVVIGFLFGRNKLLSRVLDPFVVAFYGLPKIALVPLFIVWFGIGLVPKVVMAGVLVFFLVFFSTFHGVREVDVDIVNAVRLLGASPRQITRMVILPGALSAIFLGLKIAGPEALVGAVVAEMFVSSRGVGYLVQYSASQLDTASVYAGLVALTVLAIIVNYLVALGYRYFTRKRI